MAERIVFTCRHCGEYFDESVQAFVDEPGESTLAPTLCEDCGDDAEDED